MKILIISSSHPKRRSGIIAYELHTNFKKNGHDSFLIVKIYDKYEEGIYCLDKFYTSFLKNIKIKLVKLLRIVLKMNERIRMDPNYHIQDVDQTKQYFKTKYLLKKIPFNPDVILYLFPQNLLNTKNLFELNQFTGAPIFWYLADSAPLTGGCHYFWNCNGYKNECGNCPALFSYKKDDQSHLNWKFKKKYIEKTNIIPIAASEWQWRQLNESSLFFKKSKFKIMSPTNDTLFKPSDKRIAREKLNIPLGKKIIFFGAYDVNDKRKGFDYLIESLQILFSKLSRELKNDIHLMIAGNSINEFEKNIPFNFSSLGYLTHIDLAAAFQAAYIYINTSIEDSGPTMINQAIMSGTPVVAFEMGVGLDLVKTGITGYLAKLQDSQDLANGIKSILILPEVQYELMSKNCRELALKTCSIKMVSSEFQELFEKSIIVKI